MNPGAQNAHWKSAAVDNRLLHRVELTRRAGEAFDRDDLASTHAVREHRARVVRHTVDQQRAGAALCPVAAELGAGEPELVPQGHGERFLRQDIDATLLAVHRQRDETLHRASGALSRRSPGTAEQIGRG